MCLRIITEFRAEWERLTAHLDKTDKQLATFLKGMGGVERHPPSSTCNGGSTAMDGLEVPDGPSDETVVGSPDAPAALPEAHRSDRPQAA